ncbi:MAG: hypothetical protein JWM33_1180 [Caulobacteraceae bacterium]|nr:hypothetical protein [Caulobacteraceae bacterium]
MPTRLPGWFYAILLFVSLRGRIDRRRYGLGLGGLAVWAAFVAFLARSQLDQPLQALFAAALVGLPAYCVLAKRLHDIGRRAVAAALPGALLAALLSVRLAPGQGAWFVALLAASALLCLVLLIVLAVLPGRAGDNRYGHAPGSERQRLAGVFD